MKPYDPDSRAKTGRTPRVGAAPSFGALVSEAIGATRAMGAIARKAARFEDFAIVRAVTDIRDGDKSVAAGATGTVVDVIRGGQGYVVEFTEPAHVVLSALPSELAPA